MKSGYLFGNMTEQHQKEIKLIASDLDGTLLNSNHEIHASFYPMVEQLKEKSVLFAIASGRQYNAVVKKFDQVRDDIVFVTANGSYVVHKGLSSSPFFSLFRLFFLFFVPFHNSLFLIFSFLELLVFLLIFSSNIFLRFSFSLTSFFFLFFVFLFYSSSIPGLLFFSFHLFIF